MERSILNLYKSRQELLVAEPFGLGRLINDLDDAIRHSEKLDKHVNRMLKRLFRIVKEYPIYLKSEVECSQIMLRYGHLAEKIGADDVSDSESDSDDDHLFLLMQLFNKCVSCYKQANKISLWLNNRNIDEEIIITEAKKLGVLCREMLHAQDHFISFEDEDRESLLASSECDSGDGGYYDYDFSSVTSIEQVRELIYRFQKKFIEEVKIRRSVSVC